MWNEAGGQLGMHTSTSATVSPCMIKSPPSKESVSDSRAECGISYHYYLNL